MGWCVLLVRKGRTARRLTVRDGGWLAIALFTLPLIEGALRWRGFQATQALLARYPRPPLRAPTPSQQRAAQRLAHLIRRAARYWGVTCLRQALLLWWLLRWQGLASQICWGVRRTETGLEAHAWVECGAIALGEPVPPQQRYRRLDRP